MSDHSLSIICAEGVQLMPWATRMRIAVDVARGLAFLHSLDANVIYRDLKASNVLLDSVSNHSTLCFVSTLYYMT